MTSSADPNRRSQARTVGLAVVAALIVLFAVVNLDGVEINWIIGTWETPLIVVIVLSAALGAGAGWIAAHWKGR